MGEATIFNTFSWSILKVGRQEFEAAEYFAHPNWVSALIRNDIGLIRLPQKVEFNEFIRPICLPSYSDVDDNFAGLDVSFLILYKIKALHLLLLIL